MLERLKRFFSVVSGIFGDIFQKQIEGQAQWQVSRNRFIETLATKFMAAYSSSQFTVLPNDPFSSSPRAIIVVLAAIRRDGERTEGADETIAIVGSRQILTQLTSIEDDDVFTATDDVIVLKDAPLGQERLYLNGTPLPATMIPLDPIMPAFRSAAAALSAIDALGGKDGLIELASMLDPLGLDVSLALKDKRMK